MTAPVGGQEPDNGATMSQALLPSGGLPLQAARRLAQDTAGRGLFTSNLSVSEFALTGEAGWERLGLVTGSSIYHVGWLGGRYLSTGELATLTEAHVHARNLAMQRMQAEAIAVQAEGIVGTQIRENNHGWGSHVIEYFAIGTAVVSTSADHSIPTPQLVLAVND